MINLTYERKQMLKKQGLLYNTNGSYINPDNTIVYISIPKNASSFVSTLLFDNKWNLFINDNNHIITNNTNIPTNNVQECFVILRDPFTRWISGITQYLASFEFETTLNEQEIATDLNISQETLNILCDIIDVDDHTLPQYYFYKDLYPSVQKNISG